MKLQCVNEKSWRWFKRTKVLETLRNKWERRRDKRSHLSLGFTGDHQQVLTYKRKKKYSDAGAWPRRSPSQTAGCWAASPPSAHTTQAKGHGKSNGDHALGTKGRSTKQPHVSMATREDQGQPSPFSIKDTFLAAFPRSVPKTSLFRSLRRYPWTVVEGLWKQEDRNAVFYASHIY